MKFNLIENAIDSLNEAITYYECAYDENDFTKYKFSILLLCHCAELLFKEKIIEIHPDLIYENIDAENKEDAITIGYESALKRVKNLCKVDFRHYYGIFIELAKRRNRIQHYKFDLDIEISKKIVIESFSAIQFFLITVLDKKFSDFPTILSDERLDILKEDELAYKQRIIDLKKEYPESSEKRFRIEYAENKYYNTVCPICGEKFLLKKDNKIQCGFCSRLYDSYEEMCSYDSMCYIIDHVLRYFGRRTYMESAIYECYACDYKAVIYQESSDDWKCLCCGTEYMNAVCEECHKNVPYNRYNYHSYVLDVNPNICRQLCSECSDDFLKDETSIGFQEQYT